MGKVILCWLAWLVLAGAGCNNPALPEPPCPPPNQPLMIHHCSNVCTNTLFDNHHCGRCHHACPASFVCNQGTCQLRCPTPQTACGGRCVHLLSNSLHCGSCYSPCHIDETCHNGSCRLACPKTLSLCDNHCVDLKTDRKNCNACGAACKQDEICNNGVCELSCATGFLACEGRCMQSDRNRCGSCDNVCRPDEECTGHHCVAICSEGKTICAGTCVNLQSDRKHCSACNNLCPNSHVCILGKCEQSCPAGFTHCSEECLDTTSNNKHCGGCDLPCVGGKICQSGRCQCDHSETDCSGVCVDLQTNPTHCGTCGTICPSYQGCISGSCKPVTVVGLALGESHTCVLLSNGAVKCWGANGSGQLGMGDFQDRNKPNLWPIHLGTGRSAKQIAAGFGHTCALLDDHTVKCWGNNSDGQLGYGDHKQRNKPDIDPIALGLSRTAQSISLGSHHTCALLDNHTVKCWGQNAYGQLGTGNTVPLERPASVPVYLSLGRTAKFVATGFVHTCVLLNDDQLACWGANSAGSLGYGDTRNRYNMDSSPINLGAGRTAKSVFASAAHTCALMDNNAVKCWGSNYLGQLGYGDTVDRYQPDKTPIDLGPGHTAQSISLGAGHTCALLDDYTVPCWGNDLYGQLGYGENATRHQPKEPINFGPGRKVRLISASIKHTCAYLDDNTLKCWGWNIFGELGYNDYKRRNKPDAQSISF